MTLAIRTMEVRTTIPQVVVSGEDNSTHTVATTTTSIEPELKLMAQIHSNFTKSRSVSTSTPYISRTLESTLQYSPGSETPVLSLGCYDTVEEQHEDSCFNDNEPTINHGFESDTNGATKIIPTSLSKNITITSQDSMAPFTITSESPSSHDNAHSDKHLAFHQNYSIDSGHGSYNSGLPESLDGTSHLDTSEGHSFISTTYSSSVEHDSELNPQSCTVTSDDLCIQSSKTTQSFVTSKPPISRTVPISVVKHRWTSTPHDKTNHLKLTPSQSSSLFPRHRAWNAHSPIGSPYQDEILKKMMSHFSPSEPDRLIGRKMGLEEVDILAELDARNIPVVSTILAYIPTEDLCKVSLVSQTWRTICYTDKRANIRRLKYLEKTNGKENPSTKGYAETLKENLSHHAPAQQRLPLLNRQILGENSPTKDPPSAPLDNFTKVRSIAKNLKNYETLKRCPRCQSPSRYSEAEERGNCSTKSCKYDFCTRCLCDYHGASPCPSTITKRSKKNTVNSKKSKQRLRRL